MTSENSTVNEINEICTRSLKKEENCGNEIYILTKQNVSLNDSTHAHQERISSRINDFDEVQNIPAPMSVGKFNSPLTKMEVTVLNRVSILDSLSRLLFGTMLLHWKRRRNFSIQHSSAAFQILFLLVFTSQSEAFCPHGCNCNDISVDCDRAGLGLVPILLNPQVVTIYLSNNEITNLQEDLIFYTNLAQLDLSANKISALVKKTFEGQKVLKKLTLSNNSIASLFEDNFYGLGNLEFLSLDYNSLTKIEDRAFKGLESLESLSLTNNKIKYIDNLGFEYLRSIKSINLSRNKLEKVVMSAIADLSSLEELNFSDNRISKVPDNAFRKLNNLRYLDLSRNNISVIERDALSGLEKLEYLKLVDNRLSVIPVQALPPLKSLLTFDLSGNLFHTIPRDVLGNLPALETLRIERCPRLIGISHDAFVSGWHLRDLSLRQNPHLTSLPPASLAPLLTLRTLDLSSCGLKTFQPTQIPLRELSRLDVSGNPLHCNCSLMWLAQLVSNTSLAPGTPSCAAPPALYGVPLAELGSGTCGPAIGPWTIVGCVGVALAGVLTILAFLACRWKRNRSRRSSGSTSSQCGGGTGKTIQLCIDSTSEHSIHHHQRQMDYTSPINNDLPHMQVYTSQPSYYTGSTATGSPPVQFIYPTQRQPLHSCPSDCPCIRQSPALRPLLITPSSTPTQPRMPMKSSPLGANHHFQQPTFVDFPPPPPTRPPPSVSGLSQHTLSSSPRNLSPLLLQQQQQHGDTSPLNHHYQYASYCPPHKLIGGPQPTSYGSGNTNRSPHHLIHLHQQAHMAASAPHHPSHLEVTSSNPRGVMTSQPQEVIMCYGNTAGGSGGQPQVVLPEHLLSPDWLYAAAQGGNAGGSDVDGRQHTTSPSTVGSTSDDATQHWYASIDRSSSSAGAGGNESSGYWEEDKEMPTASLLPGSSRHCKQPLQHPGTSTAVGGGGKIPNDPSSPKGRVATASAGVADTTNSKLGKQMSSCSKDDAVPTSYI